MVMLLGLAWVGLLLPPSARAGRGPVAFQGGEATSASGDVEVAVQPGGAFTIRRAGDGAELGSGFLPLIPGTLLVADSGDRLVLLDSWGDEATGGHVLRIVDGTGATVASRSVEQLFGPEVRAGFPRSMSGPIWRSDAWIDDELGLLAVVSASASTGHAISSGHASLTVTGPDRPDGETPGLVVLSLEDGSSVAPWRALARRLEHPARSAAARVLVETPGALPIEPGTLRSLQADPELRSLALELALQAPGAEDLLADALADCDRPGHQRTRAAATLVDRGDDRGAPVVLLAAGLSRRRALAGARPKDFCGKGLDEPAAIAGAIPALPHLLGDETDDRLLRLLAEDDSPGRPAAGAALALLLDRGREPRGWREPSLAYVRCSRCAPEVRRRALAALITDDPAGAPDLLEGLATDDGRPVPHSWVLDELAALGPAGLPALVGLVAHPRPTTAGMAILELLVQGPDEPAIEAIASRLLEASPGDERRGLFRHLDGAAWHLPPELVPVFAQLAVEAADDLERRTALRHVGRGGEAGADELRTLAAAGMVEAALQVDEHDGDRIDSCLAALRHNGLEVEQRSALAGRIRMVGQHGTLPEPLEETAATIGELYAAEPESRPRWFYAEALTYAGEPGRRALAGLLLRFPDDGSDQVKQVIAAIRKTFRGKPPEGLNTHLPSRWRPWAEEYLR